LQISVEDTGIGIPPEELSRVFERFYRVDKSRGKMVSGAGLGLSIVKNSAALLGGKVEAYSNGKSGAKFTVRLPLSN